MRKSCIISYGILITKYTTQKAIPRSAAISVVLTFSSASFAAMTVHSQTRNRRTSVTACISAPGATQRDGLAVVGGLWNLCNAGPCKSCTLIIIGLCGHLEVLALRYLPRLDSSKFFLSFSTTRFDPSLIQF